MRPLHPEIQRGCQSAHLLQHPSMHLCWPLMECLPQGQFLGQWLQLALLAGHLSLAGRLLVQLLGLG